jgi:hypothetical protein
MNFPSENNFIKVEEVSWQDYLNKWEDMTPDEWILRGQSFQESNKRISLKSRLERALDSYKIPLPKAPEIEEFMIREFKRKYEGIDTQIVSEDTLYSLSLMQHYGCPTRLLDCTYSPYIAAFFAVENISLEQGAERKAFVFCFNHKWINESARKNIDDNNLFKMRFDDKTRTDKSFKPLYMEKKRSFIVAETPNKLHRRLSIQRGVFIIQGDILKSMMENIKSMDGWQSEKSVIIYKLKIDTEEELKKVYEDLRLMNITHESLFPGLDGFSKSLKQNLYWYRDLNDIKNKTNPFHEGHN